MRVRRVGLASPLVRQSRFSPVSRLTPCLLSLSPSLSPCLPAPAPSPPRPGHSPETIYKTLHQPQRHNRLIKTITEQRHHTSTDAQAIYFHAITSHPAWVLCMRERVTTAACERECMRETDRVSEREERREKREAERSREAIREGSREGSRPHSTIAQSQAYRYLGKKKRNRKIPTGTY